MPTNIVGALAVELGLNTAEFENSLKNLPGLAQKHFNSMSAEMKRSSREGAESLRLIDEALGIHISRPIAKILAEDFPGLAKGLQSVLGAGVALGVGVAAFEFLSKAIDGVIKKMDEAKKAELEFEAAQRSLKNTLEEVSAAHEKQMAAYQGAIDALSGDKAGALANNIQVANIEDAEKAISDINRVAEAMEKEAEKAEAAATASHRFWLSVARDSESTHNLSVEDNQKKMLDFREQLAEAQRTDAMKGTHTGLDMAISKAKEFDAELAAAQKNRISDFSAFFDDMEKAFTGPNMEGLSAHSGFTDKELRQLESQDAEANKIVSTLKQQSEEHAKHIELLNKQAAAERDIGEKQLTKLRSETEADLALAAATSKTTAEQKLATAAGQADQIIAGVQEAAHGRLTKQVQEELLAVHALTAERQVAKDTVATNDSLEKSLETTKENTAAANELAAAYAKGGQALESALVDQQLRSQIAEVKRLHDEYDLTKKAADDYAASAASLGKQAGPKPGLDISPEHLAQLKAGLDAADSKLAELKTAQAADNQAKYNDELAKSEAALKGEQPLLDALNKAYGENEIAVRRAETALALYHWEQAHPNATQEEIARENALLEQQAIDAQRAADAKAAGQYNIATLYQDEIDKLLRIKEVLIANGDSTVLIEAKIHDAQDGLIHQWDEAAMKVGTFQEKFQAVMNEVQLKAQESAQKMAQSWVTAIDGINSSMAKLLTGQKTDFGKVVLQLAQEQTKGELEKAEASIASRYRISIPGMAAGNKPDGSSGNPLHVAIVSDQTGRAAGTRAATSPAGGGGGGNAPGGTISKMPSTPEDFFKSIIPVFGGFLEAGGSAKSGTSYIVGENGPELFRASTNGEIVPNHRLGDFTFGPQDQGFGMYQNYVRWLEKTNGSQQGLSKGLGALLGFGVSFALKGLDDLIKPHPSRGSIAAGMPARSGSLADLNALTASAGPQSSAAAAVMLPNLTEQGGVDASYLSNWASEYMPAIAGALADGGSVFAGNDYLVGERGPELFRAPGSSTTTNNRAGDVNHNTINFNGKGDPVDLYKRTSKHELDRTFARMKS